MPENDFTPELGQLAFSNTPWQEFEAPEYVSGGLYYIAEAVGRKRGDWERGGGALTSNNGADEFDNDVFTMHTYCWCDGGTHEDGCPPNFLFKETGLVINWYKHASRGVSMNREINRTEFNRIVESCIASIGITDDEIEAGRKYDAEHCSRCKQSFAGKVQDLQSIDFLGECVECEEKSSEEFRSRMESNGFQQF